jgi:inorganic pyrophosphatase
LSDRRETSDRSSAVRRLDQLAPFVPGGLLVRAVIETPRGSRAKFEYDPGLSAFVHHKLLPLGLHFPHDFGFVPSTQAEDGDPLDVLVIADEPLFTGCVVAARLIGVLEAEQEGQGGTTRNDRLIAVAATSVASANARELRDLDPELRRQIEGFLVAYNAIEGRTFRVLARRGAHRARQRIERART